MINESFLRDVEKEMRMRVGQAARSLQSVAHQRFTEKEGFPSRPGEYPAKQTGFLVGSIETDFSRSGLQATVGPEADYSLALEGMGRKMMADVYQENSGTIERIFGG